MARIWDLRPPKKTKLTKQAKKRQKKTGIYFIFFLILMGIFFIVFFGFQKSSSLPASTPVPQPSKTPTPSTNPSNKTQAQLTIKLLNGTGRYEETQKIQKMLTDSGFPVATTENALNLYDSTIVYFKPAFEKNANQLAAVLKIYNAKTQKLTQDSQYDIIIVVGTK